MCQNNYTVKMSKKQYLTLYKTSVIFIKRDTERWSSWFKAPVLKIGVRASVPWVRIPPSPPSKNGG